MSYNDSLSIPLAINAQTNQAGTTVVGQRQFTTAEIQGRKARFKITGYVSSSTLTGRCVLYNLTDSSTSATLDTTTTLAATQTSSITLSASKLYEVRIYLVAAGSTSALFTLTSAEILFGV